jgi:hypothetical protein
MVDERTIELTPPGEEASLLPSYVVERSHYENSTSTTPSAPALKVTIPRDQPTAAPEATE